MWSEIYVIGILVNIKFQVDFEIFAHKAVGTYIFSYIPYYLLCFTSCPKLVYKNLEKYYFTKTLNE